VWAWFVRICGQWRVCVLRRDAFCRGAGHLGPFFGRLFQCHFSSSDFSMTRATLRNVRPGATVFGNSLWAQFACAAFCGARGTNLDNLRAPQKSVAKEWEEERLVCGPRGANKLTLLFCFSDDDLFGPLPATRPFALSLSPADLETAWDV